MFKLSLEKGLPLGTSIQVETLIKELFQNWSLSQNRTKQYHSFGLILYWRVKDQENGVSHNEAFVQRFVGEGGGAKGDQQTGFLP